MKFNPPKIIGFVHNLGDFSIVYGNSSSSDVATHPSFIDVLTVVNSVIVAERISAKGVTIRNHPSLQQIKWAVENQYVFSRKAQATAEHGKILGHSNEDAVEGSDMFWFNQHFGSNVIENLLLQEKGTFDTLGIVYGLIAKCLYWKYGNSKYAKAGKLTVAEASTYKSPNV